MDPFFKKVWKFTDFFGYKLYNIFGFNYLPEEFLGSF